jgi:hypothetical protein
VTENRDILTNFGASLSYPISTKYEKQFIEYISFMASGELDFVMDQYED